MPARALRRDGDGVLQAQDPEEDSKKKCDECRLTPRPRCPKHGILKRAGGGQCRRCLNEAKVPRLEELLAACEPFEASPPTAPQPTVCV
jgi:hypothetical protein